MKTRTSSLYSGPLGHSLLLKMARRLDKSFPVSGIDLLRISTLLTLLILATAASALGQTTDKTPKLSSLPTDFQMQDLYPGLSLDEMLLEAPEKYAHIKAFFTIWNSLTANQKTTLDKWELYRLYIRKPAQFSTLISA